MTTMQRDYEQLVEEITFRLDAADRIFMRTAQALRITVTYGERISVVSVNGMMIPGPTGRLSMTQDQAATLALNILEIRPDAALVERRVY